MAKRSYIVVHPKTKKLSKQMGQMMQITRIIMVTSKGSEVTEELSDL